MAELEKLRWEIFCLNYVKYGAARGAGTKAAIASGYATKAASKMASDLLSRDEIKERIREIMSAGFRRLHMDITQVLKNMEAFAERPPSDDAQADRVTLQANIEIAKIHGAYKEKLEVTSGKTGIDLESLDLPLDVKRQILQSIRKANNPETEGK